MRTRLRFHYSVVWALLLLLAEWRLGDPRTAWDEALAAAMLALCFPGGLLVAVLIAATRVDPQFWDTRAGIAVGWACFFAAGYAQWFVLGPWVLRKARARHQPANPNGRRGAGSP